MGTKRKQIPTSFDMDSDYEKAPKRARTQRLSTTRAERQRTSQEVAKASRAVKKDVLKGARGIKKVQKTTGHVKESTGEPSDDSGRAAPSSRRRNATSPRGRRAKRRAALDAEIADLADYNAPPKRSCSDADLDSDNEEPMRKRKRLQPRTSHPSGAGSDPERKARAVPLSKRRSQSDRLLTEKIELQPWSHWEENSSDEETSPRSHSRHYPPKKVGVQNIPWEALSGEMRNNIYQYCLENDKDKPLNIKYYPDGIPRCSGPGDVTATNFAHSSWGFTQTCKVVRSELIPWLLPLREAHVPIATIEGYINTFVRPHKIGTRLAGQIQSICDGSPILGDGIDIKELAETTKIHRDLRISLVDPNDPIPLMQRMNSSHYDELKVLMHIYQYYFYMRGAAKFDALDAVYISSTPYEADGDTSEIEGNNRPTNKIRVTVSLGADSDRPELRDGILRAINDLVFDSRVAAMKDLVIQASFAGGDAHWVVMGNQTVVVDWKERKNNGNTYRRRLTRKSPWILPQYPKYKEEVLD